MRAAPPMRTRHERSEARERMMRAVFRRAGVAGALLLVAACGLRPDPPLSLPVTAYSGTGDLMARCMQYGSESYCEREIWGGNER